MTFLPIIKNISFFFANLQNVIKEIGNPYIDYQTRIYSNLFNEKQEDYFQRLSKV